MNGMYLDKSSHDIEALNGAIRRTVDADEIKQRIKTRLLLVQEEWFLDLSSGLPWFTELTGRDVDLYKVRSFVSLLIKNTDGVEELVSLELNLDDNRKLEIEFKCIDVFGNQIGEVL